MKKIKDNLHKILLFMYILCVFIPTIHGCVGGLPDESVNVVNAGRRCAAMTIDKNDRDSIENDFESRIKKINDNVRLNRASNFKSYNINVYFHVINKGYDYNSGNLNDTMIAKQINSINDAFNGSGFTFVLNQTDRTTNSQWFNMKKDSSEESAVKTRLKKGTARDLNVYTCMPGDNNIGWSSYPWEYNKVPLGDGVVVLYTTTPDGSNPTLNQGLSMVHEIGHWLGLYHTFEGGCCDGANCGDYIRDTPAEASPTFGCPSSRDSCNSTGSDSIWNYMNYSDDRCMKGFSYNQAQRMQNMWLSYRYNSTS